METVVYHCLSCSSATSSTIAEVFFQVAGFLAGALGAFAGVQAFLVARESHDANVLREELGPHRALIAGAVAALQLHGDTLHRSAHPAQALSRVEANFIALRASVSEEADRVLAQAKKIDQTKLFVGEWDQELAPAYRAIEDWWDIVVDSGRSESDRRYAAVRAAESVVSFCERAENLLRSAARAQLTTGLLGRKRRFRMEGAR